MNGARRIAGALAGIAAAVAAVTGAATVTAAPAPGSSASVPVAPGPVATTHAQAAGYAEEHPGTAPARSNDFGCVPSPDHPRPVVLAHGTDSNSYSDWAAVAPMLADAGWCVFALDYGKADGADEYGTGDIRVSAAQLGAFVERVRAGTGAGEVDLVGYSQGATVARYYVNLLGGSAVVERWVGVASPSYGGTFYGLGTAAAAAPGATDAAEAFLSVALVQQLQGSELLTELNTPVDTVPGVRYTTIGSRVDEVIQPSTNVALRGPGAVNLTIQDLCPQDQTGHFNMVYDPFSLTVIRHALDPERYALGECVPVPLGTGIPELIIESNS
ncbi:esterase/lipase family protein [Rhodococcus rhodochrous]|uniref:Lipase n=1 Tax=Rhodococcus rhodochrous KG-21 TaxID=1441923 RepID=A0A0M8PJW7_RHORH|nr:alpha/beta fold hydrolase [Rhodococcus rhodochrous]KOS53188.1 lipase [Rhodococcus rhodochrous KG-21]